MAAEAGQLNLATGYSLNSSDRTKIFTLGYQAPLSPIFRYKLEGGAYIGDGSSPFFGPSLGVGTGSGAFYAEYFLGPSILFIPDGRLTSWYQFNHDLGFGIHGDNGVSMGVNYKHLSNAGLEGANLGRDFLMLKIGFDLWSL